MKHEWRVRYLSSWNVDSEPQREELIAADWVILQDGFFRFVVSKDTGDDAVAMIAASVVEKVWRREEGTGK